MRRFSSYGPLDPDLHFFAPRKALIEQACTQLVGENPSKGGHYFTVWASRQTGKTWLMREVLFRLRGDERFDTISISMESLKDQKTAGDVIENIAEYIGEGLGKTFKGVNSQKKFQDIFKKDALKKPLILILDEFDSLIEEGINTVVSAFRDIYIKRMNEWDKPTEHKTYLLHGVALIGVRSVLGIENQKGSPFNVQRSLHIPNLTNDEVHGMLKWYERESGQPVEEAVIRELYDEVRGQPGLTGWFGELLTETYNPDKTKPIDMTHFKEAYGAALHLLPNNNILNLISKVSQPPYDQTVIGLFETGGKVEFNFDDPNINYLYMNGVITEEKVGLNDYYVKFSSPFVQKRIFNYFARQLFGKLGQLIHPLDAMKDAITDDTLYVPGIIQRYREYVKKNRKDFFENAPRRKTDLRIYEAIYHFNIYRYLYDLLKPRGIEVIPQFPTGNGKIDLILKYRGKIHALELKSFRDIYTFEKGIEQAASYGRQLGLTEITYLVFVELSEDEAKPLEQKIDQSGILVTVIPVGIL
ncbi:MAG: AAA family ATPase [Candidatus Omnitrophota bacterium]